MRDLQDLNCEAAAPAKSAKHLETSPAVPCSRLVPRDRYIRGLGRAQVAGYPVLFRREDDHLIELAVSSAVELQRFGNTAIFLLDGAIISDYIHSIFVPLGIDLLQLQAHSRNRSGSRTFMQREFVIVAVTTVPKLLQLLPSAGNQVALPVQVTDCMVELRIGRCQFGTRRRNVRFCAAEFSSHRSNFTCELAHLLLLLLHL